MSVAELWRRGQSGWPRSFPVAQAPNPPLLMAVAARGVAGAAAPGSRAERLGRSVFALGLGVWAWQETTSGVNWFRRLLGLAGMAWLAGRIATPGDGRGWRRRSNGGWRRRSDGE